MRNVIIAAAFCAILIGCSADQWERVATGSDTTKSVSTGMATVAEKSSVVTGIYGETLSIIALGVASVAAGVGGFARQRIKKLEKAE